MPNRIDHNSVVTAWAQRVLRPLSSQRMVEAFEATFASMWRRVQRTLGEVTLCAIVDRVLHDAKSRYPILAPLQVEWTGLRCEELRVGADGIPSEQLLTALEFTLLRFLTVLGSLTAGILSADLLSELTVADGNPGLEPDEDAKKR